MDVDTPDEKSIMTYVAQFLKAYPDPNNESATNKVSTHKEHVLSYCGRGFVVTMSVKLFPAIHSLLSVTKKHLLKILLKF